MGLSPAETNPTAFHHWILRGLLIAVLALCAWEPGLWPQLLSFWGEAPTATPLPGLTTPVTRLALSMTSPFLPVMRGGAVSHPGLKVSFSGSLGFISGV